MPASRLRLSASALFATAIALSATPPASAATLAVPAQYPSFQAAYLAAAPGDVVEVAAGVLGPQVVPYGSKPVTFRGLPGNKVRKLDNHADGVTFDGIDVDAG